MTGPPIPTATLFADEIRGAVGGEPPREPPALDGLVSELASVNMQQWDLEDMTRDAAASDRVVATAKRAIDQLNLSRHRLVHQIDVALADHLDPAPTAPLATESPGAVLDRLSVLLIRQARTAAASAYDRGYAARLPALAAQLDALVAALDGYLDELRSGTRTFVVHEPLKLYVAPADLTRGDGNRRG
jgi:hypothetical protein